MEHAEPYGERWEAHQRARSEHRRTVEGWETAFYATLTAFVESWASGDETSAVGWARLADWQFRNLTTLEEGGLRPS